MNRQNSIDFPDWVKVTQCETRTHREVSPRDTRYTHRMHGALIDHFTTVAGPVVITHYPNRQRTYAQYNHVISSQYQN